MVRGRRKDPDARKSRQLDVSRAFRERRAQLIVDLRLQNARLQERNDRLEAELAEIRSRSGHTALEDKLTNMVSARAFLGVFHFKSLSI